MARFIKLHFNSDDYAREDLPGLAKAIRIPGAIELPTGEALVHFAPAEAPQLAEPPNDETVARGYLHRIFSARDDELRALLAPHRPEVVPDLKLVQIEDSPLTPTRVIKFVQTSKAIPIFGTGAYVEIDGTNRRLVSSDATLTDTPDISITAQLSPSNALHMVEKYGGMTLSEQQVADLQGVELNFFCDTRTKSWYLVYVFKNIPIVPQEQRGEHKEGHGLGPSPRDDFRFYDYLVDAHSGSIVYYYSSQPRLDIPVKCKGVDETGQNREFYGLRVSEKFQLLDPLRNIETFDHQRNDLTAAVLPALPITSSTTDFGSSNTAGVSAHYHTKLIFDFFNTVLKRNGIDDKGMKLTCLVNVTYSLREAPPNWNNAVWWNNRMWFGQNQNGSGRFDSFARYFDIIAHELSHGITQTTSNLVYRDETGALNESFSDIFAVLLKNWYPSEPEPIATWNWEIGSGLGISGGPLRDLSNPTRTGQPAHMKDSRVTSQDDGGVHSNSGIHNKAAYNLFTARDPAGNLIFSPSDSAILYYVTLSRLTRISGFADCLRVLTSVISTYFAGDSHDLLELKRQAAIDAYKLAGIE
jgi:bacillolysin/neutral peptidase B